MPQPSTAELLVLIELPLRKRRQIVNDWAMLENHAQEREQPEQRTEYPAERQGLRSEDADTGDSLSGLRKYKARSGRKAKGKGVTVAQAAGIDGPQLQILDGGIVSPNDLKHEQGIPEG